MKEFFAYLEENGSDVARLLMRKAETEKNIVPMHYGAPFYNPISDIFPDFREYFLSNINLEQSLTSYSDPRGDIELRSILSKWYKDKYGLNVDPECEILITNGATEAISLAILVTTHSGEAIAVTNPTYMLFSKTALSLSRKVIAVERYEGEDEYEIVGAGLERAKAFIINSPENPTGYVLSKFDWESIVKLVKQNNLKIIHDEILSELDYDGRHIPAVCISELREQSILINGFSKCFGLPGVKLGWMIASESMINKAVKYHQDLYLNVSPLSEALAVTVLKAKKIQSWLNHCNTVLKARRNTLMNRLSSASGYAWPRLPYGGLSSTPNISGLYDRIPKKRRISNLSKGSVVAEYLFSERGVAVTPGIIYGDQLSDYVKIILCNKEEAFIEGLNRLSNI